jgi:hypothetical protein
VQWVGNTSNFESNDQVHFSMVFDFYIDWFGTAMVNAACENTG